MSQQKLLILRKYFLINLVELDLNILLTIYGLNNDKWQNYKIWPTPKLHGQGQSKRAKFILFGHKMANMATLDQALHKFLTLNNAVQ